FKPLDIHTGQLLLTRGDFEDRLRFLNIRNCVSHLHEIGAIPVLNENDTVAIDELRFGDNDLLAALMANALCADALVMLTAVEGLLNDDGQVVKHVEDLTDASRLVDDRTSARGTGGMNSKLAAIARVTEAGERAVIAHGREKNVLPRLLDGAAIGSVFAPAGPRVDARRRWIGLTRRPAGTVQVDAGAARALLENGRSLLAIGVTGIDGIFDRGEVVRVTDPSGAEIARGLCNYPHDELQQVVGLQSDQIEDVLGHPGYGEVIHRDNLLAGTGATEPDV
ncbi:MAG: glutamate 5-kinase, partial [Phycisphaeraceae bacterium]|nr:glutamate 5-kinase [Phycisphaeraceae bacterium]